jgi:hypothetical protein
MTTMILGTTVAFDAIVALIVPLLALMTSMPVMWRKEHFWNFSVLQIEHRSSLVLITVDCGVLGCDTM